MKFCFLDSPVTPAAESLEWRKGKAERVRMYEIRARRPKRKAVYLKYWDKLSSGAINIKKDLSTSLMETVLSSNSRDEARNVEVEYIDV
jgi:hypothetical protein